MTVTELNTIAELERLKAENAELKNRMADLTVLMMRYQELLDNVVKLREELDKALPI